MVKSAGKAAVRCKALDMAGLAAAEAHGKRLDRSSKRRVIRDLSPLVHKGLDLRALYDAHMKDVKQNAGAKKPVLHFIVRFPPELLDGPELGRFRGDRQARQIEMARQAVRFINSTHGGQAVFAARVDRDEAGETVVDVFAAPKYEKRTKRTKPDEVGATWASATKFGRELAEKHQDEIRHRHPEAKAADLTGPRMVGIALQSEFAQFFRETNGVPLTAKRQKHTSEPDRIEIEAYKALQRRTDVQARWDQRRAHRLDAKASKIRGDQIAVDQDRLRNRADRQQLDARAAKLEHRETVLAKGVQLFETLTKAIAVRLGVRVGNTVRMTLDNLKASLDTDPAPEASVLGQIDAARLKRSAPEEPGEKSGGSDLSGPGL